MSPATVSSATHRSPRFRPRRLVGHGDVDNGVLGHGVVGNVVDNLGLERHLGRGIRGGPVVRVDLFLDQLGGLQQAGAEIGGDRRPLMNVQQQLVDVVVAESGRRQLDHQFGVGAAAEAGVDDPAVRRRHLVAAGPEGGTQRAGERKIEGTPDAGRGRRLGDLRIRAESALVPTLGRLDAAKTAEHPNPAEPDLDGQLLDRRIVGGDVGRHQPRVVDSGGQQVTGTEVTRPDPFVPRQPGGRQQRIGTGQQHDLADRRRRRLHRRDRHAPGPPDIAGVRSGEPYRDGDVVLGVTAADGRRPVPGHRTPRRRPDARPAAPGGRGGYSASAGALPACGSAVTTADFTASMMPHRRPAGHRWAHDRPIRCLTVPGATCPNRPAPVTPCGRMGGMSAADDHGGPAPERRDGGSARPGPPDQPDQPEPDTRRLRIRSATTRPRSSRGGR